MGEYLVYWIVRFFGFVIRHLPIPLALGFGRAIGVIRYYTDIRYKSIVYSNLKIAFARSKTPDELKEITKSLFKNFGQNIIEIFLMPLINSKNCDQFIKIEGKEHVQEALKQGKGVILLAMHFGSWEMASLACFMLDTPYHVIVKPQKKFSKLGELLNSYRGCAGSGVISRGSGTREIIKTLKKNELIGMVVDQGGKDGELVPFFGRYASMSSGAVRLSLKLGVPICCSVIVREHGAQHRLIINKALELENTDTIEHDVIVNLSKIMVIMEHYVREYPSDYMWFYKIWKYSTESTAVILSDGKIGHLRQSQTLSKLVEIALAERGIMCKTEILSVQYKSLWAARWVSVLSFLLPIFFFQGRLQFLKRFLTEESFKKITSVKADFLISCGSSVAGLNYLLSRDQQSKSIAILKPGLLNPERFDLVVLPQHDQPALNHSIDDCSPKTTINKRTIVEMLASITRFGKEKASKARIVMTRGAPNLMTPEHLEKQKELLLKRFSHLKSQRETTIGLLLGGDNRDYILSEDVMKIVINQLKEAAEDLNAHLLVTTSRRTPERIEDLIIRELKKYPRASFVNITSRAAVEEAVGGILGLADIVVVSGESISMISEAASSGKNTVVFKIKKRNRMQFKPRKHEVFMEKLNEQGFIVACEAKRLGQSIRDVAKHKIQTRSLDDYPVLLKAVREII